MWNEKTMASPKPFFLGRSGERDLRKNAIWKALSKVNFANCCFFLATRVAQIKLVRWFGLVRVLLSRKDMIFITSISKRVEPSWPESGPVEGKKKLSVSADHPLCNVKSIKSIFNCIQWSYAAVSTDFQGLSRRSILTALFPKCTLVNHVDKSFAVPPGPADFKIWSQTVVVMDKFADMNWSFSELLAAGEGDARVSVVLWCSIPQFCGFLRPGAKSPVSVNSIPSKSAQPLRSASDIGKNSIFNHHGSAENCTKTCSWENMVRIPKV